MGERWFPVEIIAAVAAECEDLMHHTSRSECRRPEIGWLEAKPRYRMKPKILVMAF